MPDQVRHDERSIGYLPLFGRKPVNRSLYYGKFIITLS